MEISRRALEDLLANTLQGTLCLKVSSMKKYLFYEERYQLMMNPKLMRSKRLGLILNLFNYFNINKSNKLSLIY
jgi:hypothetical protein